jgi:hypothetical protein
VRRRGFGARRVGPAGRLPVAGSSRAGFGQRGCCRLPVPAGRGLASGDAAGCRFRQGGGLASGDAAGCWFGRGTDAMGHADPRTTRAYTTPAAWVRQLAGAMLPAAGSGEARTRWATPTRGPPAPPPPAPAPPPPRGSASWPAGCCRLLILEGRELADGLPAPPRRPHRPASARVSRMCRPPPGHTIPPHGPPRAPRGSPTPAAQSRRPHASRPIPPHGPPRAPRGSPRPAAQSRRPRRPHAPQGSPRPAAQSRRPRRPHASRPIPPHGQSIDQPQPTSPMPRPTKRHQNPSPP